LYNVILEPGILPGFNRDQVVDNLARLFNLPPDRAGALLDGNDRIVKREQQAGAARKYQAAMTRAGARVRLESCTAGTSAPAAPPAEEEGLALLPQEGNILADSERLSRPAAPDIDLSGLALAPPGSAMLPEEYRQRPRPAVEPPPHLKLVNDS